MNGLSTNKPFIHYFRSDSIEFVLFWMLVFAGLVIPPIIAYETRDVLWTLIPFLWLAAFSISVADRVIDFISDVLSAWDRLIGVKYDPKRGIAVGFGFILGFIVNFISTMISILLIFIFS